MKMILVAIVIVFTATCLVSGQIGKEKVAIEQEIRKLELARADEILDGNFQENIALNQMRHNSPDMEKNCD